MKLVRLTNFNETQFLANEDANFDCYFNNGIEIPPNSKIALQSVSANIKGGTLTIFAGNDGMTYQITEGKTNTIQLKPFFYNASNAFDFLTDIANKLNADATVANNGNKVYGLQWEIGTGKNGRVNITYGIGIAGEYNETADLPYWGFDSDFVRSGSPGGVGIWGLKTAETAGVDYDQCAVAQMNLSTGNGYFRAKINKLIASGGSVASNAMFMGLTDNAINPATEPFEERDLSYGIKITINGAGVYEYYTILDGVETLSAITPRTPVDGHDDNDILEVAISGNRITIGAYQNSSTITDLIGGAGFYTYTAGEKLSPFMVAFNARDKATFTEVLWTPTPHPHFTSTVGSKPQLGAHSGANPPPTNFYPIPPTKNFIEFESQSVANYVGFNFKRQPHFAQFEDIDYPDFIAQNAFTEGIAQNYLIQLMNIKIDSYDSYKSGRENILGIVPAPSSIGNIDYSPPTPYFIDMLNKDPMIIRNIKARIVSSDYSPIDLAGESAINILIN